MGTLKRCENDTGGPEVAESHEGGCLCGNVRFRVEGQPDETEGTGVCHCTFCKRRTGSAFGVAGYFPKDAFKVTRGELKTYEYRSDETNRWLKMEFCPTCGTTVTWVAEWNTALRGIAIGTFDDPNWLKPKWQVFTRSALGWVSLPESIDIYETSN